MERIIKAAVDRGASDLHIKAGDVFRARIHGKLVPLTKQALTPEQTRTIALHLMQNEDDKARLDSLTDYDCSYSAAGVGRFRVNILRQRSSFMIVMRVIPFDIPTFESLRLPPVLARIGQAERGMMLVTGVTGSGKSSTMAAMVNYINQHENRHILTLENPIEFLHRDKHSSITQREIGSDTLDFKMGLRAALRQDPDVIMIGEMRDAETVDTAIKAAETGHLLISTLHTPDAQSTILRIMAMFPPDEQEVVRIRLERVAARGDLAASAAARRRQGPRGGGRGARRDPRGARHDRRREAHRRDPRLHRGRARPVRHADVRPAPGGSRAVGRGHLRHGDGRGDEPVGLRAQDADVQPGHVGVAEAWRPRRSRSPRRPRRPRAVEWKGSRTAVSTSISSRADLRWGVGSGG